MPGNDRYAVSLIHFDGTNGSTSFPDNTMAGSSHSWTANGTAALSTAQFKFGTASLLLDGSSWINTADSTDFAFGTADFTWDYWIKRSETGTAQHNLCGQGNSGLTTTYNYMKLNPTTSTVTFAMTSDTLLANGPVAITDTNWHHIAAVRNGSNLMVAIDGVFGTPLNIGSASYTDGGGSFSVGRVGDFAAGSLFPGNIDEFRITKGYARWTSNFSVPAQPYDGGLGGFETLFGFNKFEDTKVRVVGY